MTGSKIHIIAKELVEAIEWKDDGDLYDAELFALGADYDEFIVLNPVFEYFRDADLEQFINRDSLSCTMLSAQLTWVAKYFHKNWDKSYEHADVTDFIYKNIKWEFNKDLGRDILFHQDPRAMKLNLQQLARYQFVWYITVGSYNNKVWALKCKYANAEDLDEMEMKRLGIKYKQQDVIFISYNEPNAEENWRRVLAKYPLAKRVSGVKGILNAHKAAAKLATTSMFYVVDGDAYLTEDFTFDFQPSIYDHNCVYVWSSINPINDLKYGYGGVKLFPRAALLKAKDDITDVTTSVSANFKIVPIFSNISSFNTSEFNTWRSAFRECAKLASKIIDRQQVTETDARLNIWCTKGAERQYGDWAIKGAIAGKEYGLANAGNLEALLLINDYDWLYQQYKLNL